MLRPLLFLGGEECSSLAPCMSNTLEFCMSATSFASLVISLSFASLVSFSLSASLKSVTSIAALARASSVPSPVSAMSFAFPMRATFFAALVNGRVFYFFSEKRKRSDSALWQKPLHRQKNPKSNVTTQRTPPKTSITQRLRTDLGRSAGVTIATQLVWLNRFTGSQPSH